MLLFNLILLFLLLSSSNSVFSFKCQLPNQWAGNWYQNKDIDILSINQTNFINRGICVEQKEDKFIFYDK